MVVFGVEITLALGLSVWGALLSSILAILRIKEYWTNRFNIQISPILRGHPEVGHDISIKNLSSKPVLLEYLELYRTKSKEEELIWSPEDSFLNARINPQDTKVYNFSQGDYFGWNKHKVSVKLYFAGRKPLKFDVT